MVAGLESGLSLEDAFQQAVASGTATAFTEDLATIEDIEKLNHRLLLQYLMGSEINENHRITNKDTIAMDLSASDKNGVIDELVNQLDKSWQVK